MKRVLLDDAPLLGVGAGDPTACKLLDLCLSNQIEVVACRSQLMVLRRMVETSKSEEIRQAAQRVLEGLHYTYGIKHVETPRNSCLLRQISYYKSAGEEVPDSMTVYAEAIEARVDVVVTHTHSLVAASANHPGVKLNSPTGDEPWFCLERDLIAVFPKGSFVGS